MRMVFMRVLFRFPGIQHFWEVLLDAAVADAMGEVQITVFSKVLIEKNPLPSFVFGFAAVAAGGNHPQGVV